MELVFLTAEKSFEILPVAPENEKCRNGVCDDDIALRTEREKQKRRYDKRSYSRKRHVLCREKKDYHDEGG